MHSVLVWHTDIHRYPNLTHKASKGGIKYPQCKLFDMRYVFILTEFIHPQKNTLTLISWGI